MIFNKFVKQSSNNKFHLSVDCQTKSKHTNGLNLSSPSPFPNELKKFNILYVIFSVVFIILTNKEFGMIFSILVGLCGAFMVVNIIATFKVDKLRATKFTLPASMSKEQLIDIVTLPLTQLNMKVENLSHYIRITHHKIQYDILINTDKNTFRIWPQKTLFSRLFARIHIKLYKSAIISIPIIAYIIQSEISESNTVI